MSVSGLAKLPTWVVEVYSSDIQSVTAKCRHYHIKIMSASGNGWSDFFMISLRSFILLDDTTSNDIMTYHFDLPIIKGTITKD